MKQKELDALVTQIQTLVEKIERDTSPRKLRLKALAEIMGHAEIVTENVEHENV